jgi:hypothetical protein
MYRHFIDRLMENNATAIMIFAAYAGALIWRILRKDDKPALWVNAIVTLAALAYILLVPKSTAPSLDAMITAFIAAQTVILLSAAMALCGLGIPPWINWIGFAINFAWVAVLTAYLLTFTMRLF